MHINVYYIIYTCMASGPITSWEIGGETVETVSDFILGGSKITADGDCSQEIKRRLLLGKKVLTNLDSIFKTRDITLPTKVHLVMAMVFPVVMYGCESWTVKKAERCRIDAFDLWCWRRLLRVPWTSRRSNQSILQEIIPWISFKTDWFNLLAVQETLNSFLQHHHLKASILRRSAFFVVQLSQLYITPGKTIALTIHYVNRWCKLTVSTNIL